MKRKRGNEVLAIIGGVAYVDVSTPRYPDAITLVDEHHLHVVVDSANRWVAARFKRNSNRLYVAKRCGGRKDGRTLLLHRCIMGLDDPKIQVDHRDGDSLDNRCRNLRAASAQQNAQSKHVSRGVSKYKGVAYDKERMLWQVGIGLNGKRKALGRFESEEDAARAYDAAALAHYGEFAVLNFSEQP